MNILPKDHLIKISQTWLDPHYPPSASLAKCKNCKNLMSLLLQLNGDLPDRFPGHERRLYVFGCRGKTCQKKDGSIRAIRSVRVTKAVPKAAKEKAALKPPKEETKSERSTGNLGNALFNSNPFSASGTSNPFSTSTAQSQNPFSSPTSSNPFQAANLASKPPQRSLPETSPPPDPPSISSPTSTGSDLPITFARALSLSSLPPQPQPQARTPSPWPSPKDLPPPYPPSHLDADYETLSSPNSTNPSTARISNLDIEEPASASGAETYESTLDKTFQRFADCLAQNPEQVLRYEFGGSPLLYSDTDAIGLLFSPSPQSSNSKITTTHKRHTTNTTIPAPVPLPPCPHCTSPRVFELQLTPGAILELEANETGMDGMEWGAVIVGVCAQDCALGGVGAVGYGEEWVGVQWEEGGGGGGGR